MLRNPCNNQGCQMQGSRKEAEKKQSITYCSPPTFGTSATSTNESRDKASTYSKLIVRSLTNGICKPPGWKKVVFED